MKLSKIQWLGIIYVISLIFAFFYVRNALEEGNIEVKEAPDVEAVDEVKPAKVSLVVETAGSVQTYVKALKNKDTVQSLMELVREEDNMFYEIVSYIDDAEVVDLYRTKAPEGYSWRVFYKENDITNSLDEITLLDGETYYLRMMQK